MSRTRVEDSVLVSFWGEEELPFQLERVMDDLVRGHAPFHDTRSLLTVKGEGLLFAANGGGRRPPSVLCPGHGRACLSPRHTLVRGPRAVLRLCPAHDLPRLLSVLLGPMLLPGGLTIRAGWSTVILGLGE